MNRILGIDPGYRNLGIVDVEWSTRVRRVLTARTVVTSPKTPDSYRWALVLDALQEALEDPDCPNVVACEEMTGVRHGHNARGTTSGNADELIEVQGAIRSLARVYEKKLVLVRSLSSYAAMGVKLSAIPNEDSYHRKARLKAATMAAAKLWFSGADDLTEHEADACIHAGAVRIGKGVIA